LHEGKFRPCTDFKTAFIAAVTKLTAQKMPISWRIKACGDLCEAYVNQTGELPDGKPLEWLADYILVDDLGDKCPDKVTNTEYPFLSEGQTKVRNKRELPRADFSLYTLNKLFQKKSHKKRARTARGTG